MSNIQFDDDKVEKRNKEEEQNLTGLLQNSFGISETAAKNAILTIVVVLALVSIYFWIQAF